MIAHAQRCPRGQARQKRRNRRIIPAGRIENAVFRTGRRNRTQNRVVLDSRNDDLPAGAEERIYGQIQRIRGIQRQDDVLRTAVKQLRRCLPAL